MLGDLRARLERTVICHFIKKRDHYRKALAKIATRSKPCSVCALGALFIGSVDKFNKLNFDFKGQDYQDREKILTNLNSSFSQEQLVLIEYAFECWLDPDTKKPGPPAIFGSRYSNDTTRLRAIMNNIITNKGTFIP